MCGILGLFFKDKKVNVQQAKVMLDSIRHRGPDGQGFYSEKNVFLGHNRLSFLDLSEKGDQPMWDSKKQVCIVFNGEIYNFNELKEELSKKYFFKSHSDTEVLLYGFIEWGLDALLKKIRGMFAFSIYDKKNNKLFLVRDFTGLKPLVYYIDDEKIVFGSELKIFNHINEIPKVISFNSLKLYFELRYIPAPYTIYDNIFKLEAGHYIEIDLNKKYSSFKKKKYFDYSNVSKKNEDLRKSMVESVSKHLISDVEVGTFLSGGIDSSIVTLLASEKKKINSFSIDLRPKKYSEITYARLIKNNNITFNSRIVSKKEFKKYFSEMFNYFDEPFADSSFVPFYLLCKYSREKDIKAFLSGDGADELFGGYIWHEHYYKTRLIPGMDFLPRKVINLLEYNLHFGKYFSLIFCSKIERYRRIMFNRFSQKEVDKLLSESTTTSATKYYESLLNNKAFTVESLREIDLLSFLQNDINYKVDMGSMANSIEVRTPFIDPEIFSISKQHSFSSILSKEKKFPLKRSFKDILPEKTIHRPKKGFSAPVGEWMLDNNVVLDEDSLAFSKNILKYEEFKKIKYKGNISKIWMILVLEEFLKKNISYISA